jgi:hypothetical protein
MFISQGTTPFPPRIWSKWGKRIEDADGSLFLHFGPDLTVMLSVSELLDLDLVVAAAIDDSPVPIAAPKSAEH